MNYSLLNFRKNKESGVCEYGTKLIDLFFNICYKGCAIIHDIFFLSWDSKKRRTQSLLSEFIKKPL